MTDPTLELRSHRPAIARDQVDALRRRLFGEVEALPEIPGYQIEQKLGEGSFGVVYRAFHPGFQRRVALKLIEYHSPRSLLRIDREAQALARLSHPNVVQVYDKGPAGDDRYYLALEYVEGVPLDTWLGQGPYPLPTILEKFLQIADGLSAAHAAGLVHRDLKPANAIVGSDGRVRVLDFGLARAPDATLWPSRSQLAEPPTSAAHDARGSSSCAEAESSPPAPSATVAHVISGVPAAAPVGSDGCEGHSQLERRVTAEGHFIGTPYYAAPEQHLGRADERSDQFSFCVALYEGVYGQKPYRLRAGGSLLDQLLAQSLQFPKARPPVPRWLTTLLQRGLQLDPDARHPSMRAIADELRYRLHHRPGRVRPLALAAAAVAVATAVLIPRAGPSPEAERVARCVDERGAPPAAWSTHEPTIAAHDPRLAAELGALAQRWSSERASACHVAEAPRRESIDACLDVSRTAFEHLVGWLGSADAPTWARLMGHPGPRPLAELVDTLPDPTRCLASAERDRGAERLPAWQRLLDARMLLASGDLDGAALRTELATAEARRVGASELRVAAAYQGLMLDVAEYRAPTLPQVLDPMLDALAIDRRALASEIAAFAVMSSTQGELRFDAGSPSPRLEAAVDELEAAAGSDPARDGWTVAMLGYVQLVRQDSAAARSLFHEAATLLRATEPAVPDHLVAMMELHEAIAMTEGPDATSAPALAERALQRRRASLGEHHPQIAANHLSVGQIYERLDDHESALRHYRAAASLDAELHAPLHEAIARGEIVRLHYQRAREALAERARAKAEGRPTEPFLAAFERHRADALEELALVDLLLAPFRPSEPDPAAPVRRPAAQARLEVIAQRAYALRTACWSEMLEASQRLDRVCAHLEGDDPSCAEGRRQWREMLGMAAPITDEPCRTDDASR